jgi:hypothetical protein
LAVVFEPFEETVDELASGSFEVELNFETLDKSQVDLLQPKVVFAIVEIQCGVRFFGLFFEQPNILKAIDFVFKVDIVEQ